MHGRHSEVGIVLMSGGVFVFLLADRWVSGGGNYSCGRRRQIKLYDLVQASFKFLDLLWILHLSCCLPAPYPP